MRNEGDEPVTPPEEAGQGRAETSERRQDARLILVMRGLRSLAYGLLAVLLQRVAEKKGVHLHG
jgi:hypothetical protein